MKKTILFTLIFAVIAILAGCASQGGASSRPAGQNPGQGGVPAAAAQEQYSGAIILDGAQRYTVNRGDTLSRIAINRYNNGYLYPLIYIASRNVVQNPDRLSPGMVLTIPNLQLNLIDPTARANLKNILLEMAVFEDQQGRPRTAADMRILANGL